MSRADLRWLRQSNARLERQRAELRELKPRALELQTIEAADFVTGGEADFARASNVKGSVIATWRAGADESYADFIVRSKQGAEAIGAAPTCRRRDP
jgi:hypothetical protein